MPSSPEKMLSATSRPDETKEISLRRPLHNQVVVMLIPEESEEPGDELRMRGLKDTFLKFDILDHVFTFDVFLLHSFYHQFHILHRLWLLFERGKENLPDCSLADHVGNIEIIPTENFLMELV